MLEITGTADELTAAVFEGGKRQRSVRGSRATIESALLLVSRLQSGNPAELGLLSEQQLQPEVLSGIHRSGIKPRDCLNRGAGDADDVASGDHTRPSGVLRVVGDVRDIKVDGHRGAATKR